MINQSTITALRAMKLTAMADELEAQFADQTTYSQLGFEDRLGLLVDAEWNRRKSNKLLRFIRNARFAEPGATIEGIEYHDDRKLDKAQILRLASCQYIEDGHHIILKGASGNGKTYLSNALGNAACRKFKSVRYIRMPELLDELSVAKGCGTFRKTIKTYQKVELLILDEPSMGLAPKMVENIFAVIGGLRERGVALLLIEQNARLALEVTDSAWVMDSGSIVHHGESKALLNDDQIAQIYLGEMPV